MKKEKITIVTFPSKGSTIAPLSNIIDILYEFSGKVNLITGIIGCKRFKKSLKIDHCYKTQHKSGNLISRILSYVLVELKISYYLFKLRNKADVILFLGGDTLLLPMLTAKLLRKRILLNCGASSYLIYKSSRSNLSKLIALLSYLCYSLTDTIILYSPNLIKEWKLEKFSDKISIAYEHHLNLNEFKIKNGLEERKYDIGYIGRLSPEKGIMDFLESIPELLNINESLKFLIGGDGPLKDEVKEYLKNKDLMGNVHFVGWISRSNLPNFLNQIKIIVLPSYTEGLPNIMLEAMACGTLVLATPVGSIPDIIENGKTGFIIKNNILKSIINVLNHEECTNIINTSRKIVEKKFRYDEVLKMWNNILEI